MAAQRCLVAFVGLKSEAFWANATRGNAVRENVGVVGVFGHI
jgi:hypothetical protein